MSEERTIPSKAPSSPPFHPNLPPSQHPILCPSRSFEHTFQAADVQHLARLIVAYRSARRRLAIECNLALSRHRRHAEHGHVGQGICVGVAASAGDVEGRVRGGKLQGG